MKVKQLKKLLAKVDDNATVLMDDGVRVRLYSLRLSKDTKEEKFFVLTTDEKIVYQSDGEKFIKAE